MLEGRETSSVGNGGRQDYHALNDHRVVMNYWYKPEKGSNHGTTYHVMYSCTVKEVLFFFFFANKKEHVKRRMKY